MDTDTSTLPPLPQTSSISDDDVNSAINQLYPTSDSSTPSPNASVQPDSATVSGLKSAAAGVTPAAAAAGGFEGGALLGAAVPVLGETGLSELAFGTVGAIAAAVGASKAQKAVLDKVAPNAEAQLSANEEAHPIASAIGDIASSLPVFEFAPGQTVNGVVAAWKAARGLPLGKTAAEITAAKNSILALGAQAGLGAGTAVVSPLIQGQTPDLKDVGISTLSALLFGKPRDYVDSAFKKLGLQKPVAAQDSETGEPATADSEPVTPPPSNVTDNPAAIYDIPQTVKESLTVVAQKEAQNGFQNLDPDDVRIMQNATDANQGSPSFHKDALAFYSQQVAANRAAIDKQKAADFATSTAHPAITDAISDSRQIPVEDENAGGELPPSASGDLAGTRPTPKAPATANHEWLQNNLDILSAPLEKNGVADKISDLSAQRKTSKEVASQLGIPLESVRAVKAKRAIPSMDDKQEFETWLNSRVQPDPLLANKDFANMQRPHAVGVEEGLKLGSDDVDRVKALQAQSNEALKDAVQKNDDAAFKTAFSQSTFLGGVIEGAQKKGPNYDAYQAEKLASQPLAEPPTPAAKPAELKLPAWQKLRGETEDIAQMTEESAAQVKRQETQGEGQGQKRAQTFEETADPSIIYSDTRAGQNRSNSRKLVAMESPDGSHVAVGTAYESPTAGKLVRRVTSYDAEGKPTAKRFDDMVAEGWKPVATIKTNEPTKNHIATYSPDEWEKIASDMRERGAADQRTTEAMQGHLEASKEFGLENAEEEKTPDISEERPAGEENSGPTRLEHFEPEHAEAIFDAIHGDEVENAQDVINAINDHGLALEFESALRDSGMLQSIKTQEDALEVAATMAEKIYDTYSATGKNSERFSKRLQKALLDESGQPAAGEKSRPVRAERSGANNAGAGAAESNRSTDTRAAGGATPEAGRAGSERVAVKPATAVDPNIGEQPESAGVRAERRVRNRLQDEVERRWNLIDDLNKVKLPFTDDKEAERKAVYDLTVKHDLRESDGPIRSIKDEIEYQFAKARTSAKIKNREPNGTSTQRSDEGKEMAGISDQHERNTKTDSVSPENSAAERERERLAEVRAADENNKRLAQEAINRYRMAPARAAQIFRQVSNTLQSLGVDVKLLHDSVSGMAKDAAKYEEWKNIKGELGRAITISMADTNVPTVDNLVALLHEAAHAVFARETPERQAMLHMAIAKASDETLGLKNFFEKVSGRFLSAAERAQIAQEGRLAESTAKALVAQGFAPEEAMSVVQRIGNALKNLYQRAAMAVMEAMNIPVSPERAMDYFQTRMKLALLGSKVSSIVSILGGPRVRFPEWDHESAVESAEAFLVTRNRDQAGTSEFNPMTTQQGSGDIANPSEEKVPQVAAEGVVHNVMDQMFRAFNEEGFNESGIEPEVLASRFFPGEPLPADNVKLINDNLTRNGHDKVNPAIGLNDIASKPLRDEAAARAIARLDTIKESGNAKRVVAESVVRRINKVLPKNASDITTAIKNHSDLDMISGQAAVKMQEVIGEMSASRDQITDLNRQQSMLEQNIRQLDSEIKGNTLIPKPWVDALDKLYSRLSSSGGDIKFSDMLQRLAEKQLDWNLPAHDLQSQIRDMISDTALEPLQGNDHESRALLATAITFAKKNDFLLNLLTLRKTTLAGEHTVVNEALQKAMESNANAVSDAALYGKKLQALRPLLAKLLKNISQMKKEQHDLLDERQRQTQFINFHNLANPIIDTAIRPLESQIGAIRQNVAITPVTEVTTPPTPDARPENFTTKKLFMSKADGKVTLTPEIRDDIQKRQAWLDANRSKRDQLGAVYNYQEALNRKLSEYIRVYGMATPIKEFWISKWLAPTAERFRLIGTPTARAAAVMIEKANTIYNGLRTPGTIRAHQWEVARSDAMKALGVKNLDNFKRNVDDAFKDYSSKNKDARAKFSNSKDAAEAAVKAGVENLRQNPQWREALSDPKRARAVEEFFRKNVEMNEWIAENGRNMGNKIYDPKLGLFRNAIGSAEAEYSRSLSIEGDSMFRHMGGDKDTKGAWMAPMKPDEIAGLYAAKDPKLEDIIKPRFTPEVWNKFVRWVAYKDGTSSFSSPLRSDGTTDYARRDNVIKAYENNSGNPIGFARDLFHLETQMNPEAYKGADVNKFVGDTMHSFQSQFEILKSMAGDVAESDGRGLPTPGKHLMDARLTDAAPRQFYSYVDYDRSNVPRLTRVQAYNAAFGRNLEAFYQTVSAAEKEQQDLVNTYDNIASEFPDLTGKKLRKAVLEAAKGMTDDGSPGGRPLNVEALSQAHQRLSAVQKALNEQKGNFASNQGRPPEMAVLATLMHGIGSLTVSGPGTAIIAHTIAFEQMIRNFGLNADGIGMLLNTGKSVVTVALRGAMQSFGRQMVNEGDHLAMLEKYGNQNPNTLNKWSNDVKAIVIRPDYVSNVLGRGAIYTGRAMQTVAQRISAFHYVARVCQLASSKAWCDKIAGSIEKGIEHFTDHPADMADSKFNFTAKQLGLSGDDNGRAFKYLNHTLSKYGLDLRQMVEDAMSRRKADDRAPLLTDDIYRKIAQVSLDDNTLESSPTTRPAFLTNNYLGQLLNPMFGWALEKSYVVPRAFRDPNGEKSVSAFKSASLAYLGILPLAMVAAYLRNKFDEDVQGKKQNVSDLSTIQNPQEAFLTMMDNAARVGTFGIAGEALNIGFNKDNSRPLSLDGRLFVVSTIENTFGAISNMAHQRDFDYQTVVRPLLQSLGGNGFFQYAGIINHQFALDNAEARTMNRISVNNYLRVAGRATDMDVRTYAGMVQSASQPNPWRASIGNMVMAAYANDAQGFNAAKSEAIQKLVEAGYSGPDARNKVLQSYEDSNPLKIVFRSTPSQAEYQKMLGSMDDNGKVATATALRLYQHYGQQLSGALGIQNKRTGDTKAFTSIFGRGTTPQSAPASIDPTLRSMMARVQIPGLN